LVSAFAFIHLSGSYAQSKVEQEREINDNIRCVIQIQAVEG